MKWEELEKSLDEETFLVIDIAREFLTQYFGSSDSEARTQIAELLTRFPDAFDEDGIHRDSSYGVAASASYLIGQNGSLRELSQWMYENGHNRVPRDALEHFNSRYFGSS